MNQKDYQEIAEIIREKREFEGDPNNKQFNDGYDHSLYELAYDLADYFEREDKGRRFEIWGIPSTKKDFNRQQFLKDCGVE